eukprot:scaffold180173_cov17-Tisochrysis_lutea.AAC.1
MLHHRCVVLVVPAPVTITAPAAKPGSKTTKQASHHLAQACCSACALAQDGHQAAAYGRLSWEVGSRMRCARKGGGGNVSRKNEGGKLDRIHVLARD